MTTEATSVSKTLDKTDPKVIDDAVRLSKTDFTALYEKMGYTKVLVQIGWHSIRSSKQGQEAMDRYKQSGVNPEKQPVTFISNVEEEAAERVKEPKAKKEKVEKEKVAKVKKEKVVKEKKVKEPKATKEPKAKKEKKAKSGKKGDKSQAIKDLIAAGETDWKVLVEKTGASVVYTKRVLSASKKA